MWFIHCKLSKHLNRVQEALFNGGGVGQPGGATQMPLKPLSACVVREGTSGLLSEFSQLFSTARSLEIVRLLRPTSLLFPLMEPIFIASVWEKST